MSDFKDGDVISINGYKYRIIDNSKIQFSAKLDPMKDALINNWYRRGKRNE